MLAGGLMTVAPAVVQADPTAMAPPVGAPRVGTAAAFDVSPPLRDLARIDLGTAGTASETERTERGPVATTTGHAGDGALQDDAHRRPPQDPLEQISAPQANFEGVANSANPRLISPPDPDGDVGPNHYVQVVNVQYAVYSKTGTRLVGPAQIGTLFAGFPIRDCTGFNGDPIVLHDQQTDRWLITQFTVSGPEYWNCVAISTGPDPTGSYYRYAFSTGPNFPDYPKYGVWPDSYFISTREFAPDDSFAGVGAYALEKRRMLVGDPQARVVSFVLAPGETPWLPGDGLLPTDWDGAKPPTPGTPNWFVGTQDDQGPYGAPYDAVNVFEFHVDWKPTASASFSLVSQQPVAEFDSAYPCAPGPRNCIAQPGTTNKVDILSIRQRPTWRLAYRNFGTHESLVTNQSVEARPGVAGARWYELRRTDGGVPTVYQQGTYAPDDGVQRWMGSVAQDRHGNLALGYSVSNAVDVYPGIRYTGRLVGDPAGVLARGEQTLIAGTGSQLTSARWGDYTAMHVDPVDDCTFWYTNQYYATSSNNGWQTRIGSFSFPSCH